MRLCAFEPVTLPVLILLDSSRSGPGMFDFTQGDTQGSSLWRLVRDLISTPSQDQQACHAPKPILLNTGYLKQPYPWQPDVTELSMLRLGNVVRTQFKKTNTISSVW
jgi:hypothetical protein